ncbi:MAG: hypothetical protein WA672_08820 [Candidatus Angelobacter sp.]
MSEIVINLIKKAIEDAKANLATLEQELVRQEKAHSQEANPRGGRTIKRRSRGFRDGSVPQVAQTFLVEGPLGADVLADRISKRIGKEMNARDLGIALSKYIRQGKFFERTEDGRYGLRK